MKKGNALILSIILVSLFIIISFGVTNLIIQSTLNVQSIEASHRAFYAAESGVELSLLALKKHLPGFEEQKKIDIDPLTNLDYTIKAQVNRIPSSSTSTSSIFPNQTVTLALFKDTGRGDTISIQDLKSPNSAVVRFESTGDSPCFRWAVFGFKNKNGELITESLGDYLCPPTAPSLSSESTSGKFKDAEGKYYPQYAIQQFLSDHTQNYLAITNLSPSNSILRYDLNFQGDTMADEKFLITASGQFKNFIQTEQVSVPQGDLLPIFYFAVFSPK